MTPKVLILIRKTEDGRKPPHASSESCAIPIVGVIAALQQDLATMGTPRCKVFSTAGLQQTSEGGVDPWRIGSCSTLPGMECHTLHPAFVLPRVTQGTQCQVPQGSVGLPSRCSSPGQGQQVGTASSKPGSAVVRLFWCYTDRGRVSRQLRTLRSAPRWCLIALFSAMTVTRI